MTPSKALLALAMATLSGVAMAEEAVIGDPDAGRKLAGMCRTCHGLDGVARIPIAPHIGGENPLYIRNQLAAFRSGARKHEMMSVVSASLSDQQIADVSAWYASITPIVTPPESHAAMEEAGKGPDACAACHGYDGVAQVEDVPNLAGEGDMYIIAQLQAFRVGRRSHEVMNAIAADLTDEDITALAEWYAAIGFDAEMPTKP